MLGLTQVYNDDVMKIEKRRDDYNDDVMKIEKQRDD
jgi:hypothetical protein